MILARLNASRVSRVVCEKPPMPTPVSAMSKDLLLFSLSVYLFFSRVRLKNARGSE